MLLRRLFALLIGLAMTVAPLGMAEMSQAAVPAMHHGGKAAAGHCDEQQAPSHHGKAADKSCCAAMCIAIVVPSGVGGVPAYHASRQRPASDIDRRGYLGEIATPPPRAA